MSGQVSPFGAARWSDRIAVPLVTLYLLGVGAWLVLRRRIPAPGFGRLLRASMRAPYRATLTQIAPETGCCYVAPLPAHLLSDLDSRSDLVLHEDGRALGPAHAAHADIRASGAGSYSHWGARLYFSTSDNSDPRTNGRVYQVTEQRARLKETREGNA